MSKGPRGAPGPDVAGVGDSAAVAVTTGDLGHTNMAQSQHRVQSARKAYESAALLNNPKKGFEAETRCNFWGIDADGDKGLMRASYKRLWPCMVITCWICTLGLCTIGLLQGITGMWVSLLGVRR